MDPGFYPAMGGGGFARAQELGPWLDLMAVRGEVIVQFWLKPGEAAVTLGAGEERHMRQLKPNHSDITDSPRLTVGD